MPAPQFDFPNAEGLRLAGLIDLPAGETRAYALFAHCFTCGKDVHAARRIAEALTALGIGVLRFDFTGLGSSQGDFANSTFSSNVADLVRATGEGEVVKVKSLTTDEIGLNDALAAAGVRALETDLAALILQLDGDLDLRLTTSVEGELRQSNSTAAMVLAAR